MKKAFQTLFSFSRWNRFFHILSKKEKIIFLGLLVLFVGSAFYLTRSAYLNATIALPKPGGELIEGMVGYPNALNPVIADANEVDRALTQVLYASLFSYNKEGELTPDLVERYEITEGGRVIELTLKENLKWNDEQPLTADDVLFTIQAIQDPRYKSPIRRNWVGVQAEKISALRIRITLRQPYAPFLERLNLGILPKHIWESQTPETIERSGELNIMPVSNGPYRIAKYTEDKTSGAITEMRLERNPFYHKEPAYISSVIFKFFPNAEARDEAAKRGQINAFSPSPTTDNSEYEKSNRTVHRFSLPRYFSIFFNLESEEEALKNRNVRQALNSILDKSEIAETVFEDRYRVIHSPLLPSIFEFDQPASSGTNHEEALALLEQEGYIAHNGRIGKLPPSSSNLTTELARGDTGTQVRLLQECLANPAVMSSDIYPEGTVSGIFGPSTEQAVIRFQNTHPEEILAPSNLSEGNGHVGPATIEMLNKLCFADKENLIPLRLRLTVPDEPSLQSIAEGIANQWDSFGIETEIIVHSPEKIRNELIPLRNYDAILFGEVLTLIPDPLPFWHSTQSEDPGFNLSSYKNAAADELIEDIRQELDETVRNTKLAELQQILLNDMPAIFLYDTPYLYVTPDRLQGIRAKVIADPSQRFSGIETWYLETKRIWK